MDGALLFSSSKRERAGMLQDTFFDALVALRPARLAEATKKIFRIRRRSVECRFGIFCVDPVSDLGAKLRSSGRYEPAMEETLLSHLTHGNLFVDIGANEGYFTVIGSKAVGNEGRVISIEPQSRLEEVIKTNIKINSIINVTYVKTAISDKAGTAEIYLTSSTNTGASGLVQQTTRARSKEPIPTKKLSDILDANDIVDLMKIDVEGYEYESILGSKEIFLQRRVRAIALELHPQILRRRGLTAMDIVNFLSECGYNLEDNIHNTVWSLNCQKSVDIYDYWARRIVKDAEGDC
jgi:FkbM family methyltransferase